MHVNEISCQIRNAFNDVDQVLNYSIENVPYPIRKRKKAEKWTIARPSIDTSANIIHRVYQAKLDIFPISYCQCLVAIFIL